MFDKIVSFIRNYYNTTEGFIPLHEPRFVGNDRKYVLDAIDSTFVSSVGKYVDEFEQRIIQYTNAKYAIATVNGTAALHMALLLSGVKRNDEVLTQPLSFVATSNAINYIGADPIFLDVDKETLGLSPASLEFFLERNAVIKGSGCYNIKTGRRIAACLPMHTFGFPCRIQEIIEVCAKYGIPVVEDAAESIGSRYQGKHTGTFGLFGTFSFNGNKIITCGGGGAIITNDEKLGKLAKHLTTQAKMPHRWKFVHDHIGFNYRMPNLNAALACAQMEKLDEFIANKRKLSQQYEKLFEKSEIEFIKEPINSSSNYWLNCILLKNCEERDSFLTFTNDRQVMTRPAWSLINKLEMFRHCICENIDNAIDIESRLVNLPSSVRI